MPAVICGRKKKWRAIIFIIVLFSASIVFLFVDSAMANPLYQESISPPSDVKPSVISFDPQINNTVYNQNTISLTVDVSIPETEAINKYGLYINNIRIQRDWNNSDVRVYSWGGSGPLITDFSGNLTIADIPEGSHTVTFIANMHGGYFVWETATSYNFRLASYSNLYFSVDTTSPSISLLSITNRTYKTPDVPLNFTVSEFVTEVSYSLDGQSNVTVAGNTTLKDLPVGEHNVTVYATDKAENTGESETIHFTIEEPFPTTMVIVPITSVAFIGVGLLVYFKKRR
jgi:hypothetical protein